MSARRCDWCGASGFLHLPQHGSTDLGAALCCNCTDEFMKRVAVTLVNDGKALEAASGWSSWLRRHDEECGVLA